MSYILDALKKADAERARGQSKVPGLHATPAPLVEEPAGPPFWSGGLAIWVVAALLGLLVALLGWHLWRAGPSAVPSAPARSVQAPAVAVLPTPGASDAAPASTDRAPATPPPLSGAASVPAARVASSDRPAALTSRSPGASGEKAGPPVASQAGRAIETRAAPAASAASGSTVQPPAVPATRPAEPVYTLQTLPDALRRDLPPLTVGGAMHSDVPAQRMLILNSQVFREGDQPVPDLVLEEIRLRSAVFRFRGSRFSVAY